MQASAASALILVVLLAQGASAEPAPERWLDHALERGVPGISVVVDRPGEEAWEGAAGLASIQDGEAMTPGHAIHWASVTKQVTAAAVLRLVDEGRLSLDRPILDLLDEPEVAALPHAAEVRVGQLLDHSSGSHGYLRLSDVVRQIVDVERFPQVRDDLLDSTAAGERLDGAAGIVGTARDLHRFARAYLKGDLLSPASRGLVLSVAEGLEEEPPGTERQRIAAAYRESRGVIVAAEGDGPGGSHSLIAFHPATGTLVAALVNHFGFFDEDELLRELVADVVAGGRPPD